MDLEEQDGVDPVIERRATLTRQEIQAALDSGGPYLCTVHANEEVALDEDVEASS
jgi:hypothetical protein